MRLGVADPVPQGLADGVGQGALAGLDAAHLRLGVSDYAPSGSAESVYRAWRVGTHDADDYHFAICRRSDEELVGSIGLRFIGHPGTGDVGYWVGEPHWNHGYASEAVKLVSHLAFEHLDAHALTSWVFLGNDSSRRVLEKAGFRYVRTSTRGHQGRDPVPEWSLALLRDEWKGREQVWKPRSESVIAVP